MSLRNMANETLQLLEAGGYRASDGSWVDLAQAQARAVEGSFVLTPERGAALLAEAGPGGAPPVVEVTEERTQEAAWRLVVGEGREHVVVLNFASARNPGGGFLNGAKAQEEDLARSSGLYPCLVGQELYYRSNREQDSMLYTDHLIYSPQVPWFRTRSRDLLDQVFVASVITAPAPNAGQALRRDPAAGEAIEAALRQRAGLVLALARAQGHRELVLGAWGCGVFMNDPAMVADAFGRWLASETFAGAFERVTFAIYDRSKGREVGAAFERRFEERAPSRRGS
jgi:uncharacterized protein (TIGR02452 family)